MHKLLLLLLTALSACAPAVDVGAPPAPLCDPALDPACVQGPQDTATMRLAL